MTKFLYIGVLIYPVVYSMEVIKVNRTPREWNAIEYAQGNSLAEIAALRFLEESGISIVHKDILDVGCGTGNISKKMLDLGAQSVHGCDASKNMIAYARKTYTANELSFKRSFVEDFTTQKYYDLATVFFCFHWIKDHKQALSRIHAALKPTGELLCTAATQSLPDPVDLKAALSMIPGLPSLLSWIKENNFAELIGRSNPTDEELKAAFHDAGFEIISYEPKNHVHIFKDKLDVEKFLRPIAMSRPLVKAVPEFLRGQLFQKYVNTVLEHLQQDEQQNYLFPIDVIVCHARKKSEH